MQLGKASLKKECGDWWIGKMETKLPLNHKHTSICRHGLRTLFSIPHGTEKLRLVISTCPSKQKGEVELTLREQYGDGRWCTHYKDQVLSLVNAPAQIEDFCAKKGIKTAYVRMIVE